MTRASPMHVPGEKIPVAVLGATGSVGRRFVELLEGHPWFELTAVAASPRSVGGRYGDLVPCTATGPVSARVADLVVVAPDPPLGARVVFSALDAEVAGPIETCFAASGALVVSNARSHRYDVDVPLLVPEINAEHLALLEHQDFPKGAGIITNPNCSTIGLVTALAPLRPFGLRRLHVVTMQALSGAGALGPGALEVLDNVVPYIPGEEEKLAREPRKILGTVAGGRVLPLDLVVSAQCNRVPVLDGHTECVSVELGEDVDAAAILDAWRGFAGPPEVSGLPSAPERPLLYLDDDFAPQPRKHRDIGRGMTTTIGRLQPCPVLGWRFVCLSHNTLRGAAGGALLSAELAVARGLA